MKVKTFKKGICVPHSKHTANVALAECPTPELVAVPLAQHIGKSARPTVAVGDRLLVGSKIGEADGPVSAHVFSSVSGVVKDITVKRTPTGACTHVIIANDGEYAEQRLPDMPDRSRASLLARIKDAGLVGMGGAGFPAHIKYAPKNPVDTFIINAAECEPYITCDYRLLVEHTEKVVRGAGYLAAVLGLDEVTFGIEDNKPDAVAALTACAKTAQAKVNVAVLKSKYPQGAEKQLIYAVTGRKVPAGKLPSDVGVAVGNVHTAYALCEAAEENIPLYRRALTVCGEVVVPANLWVRTGTPYSACVDFCGGIKGEAVKLVSGGPMMGFALDSLDYSVTKTSGSVLALDRAHTDLTAPGPCINCAKCARVCPMNLMPMYIDAYTRRGDYAAAKRYGAADCIECGCCAYGCPAKRPLVQSVKLCKAKLRELKL